MFSCSNDDATSGNLPPRNFNVESIQSGYNSLTIQWTESTDPENAVVKHNIYIAKNEPNAVFTEVAFNLHDVNAGITPDPSNPDFRFEYTITNLEHNQNWKGKVVVIDQEDTVPPVVVDTEVKNIYKHTAVVSFEVFNSGVYTNDLYFYLNGNLMQTPDCHEFRSNYRLNNLTAGTQYELKIIINDDNVTSNPAIVTYTTLTGFTYFGDLDFNTQEQLDSFASSNFTKIQGDLEITFSCAACDDKILDFTPLDSLEELDGNLSIVYGTFGFYRPNSVSGLNSLILITENIYLAGINPSDIFNNLEIVEGNLSVFNYHHINNEFPILENLKNVEELGFFDGCVLINSFGSFNLKIGSLFISNNDFNNLDFLFTIVEIESNIYIQNNFSLINLCGLKTALIAEALTGNYALIGNAYNPTIQDFLNGDCSM